MNKGILQEEAFIKITKGITDSLFIQIHDASSNKRLQEDIKSDWVKGYVYGYTSILYQMSGYAENTKGLFYMLASVFGHLKIESFKENFDDYKNFFEDIENKIDSKNNDLYRGFEKATKDLDFNIKNKGNPKAGRKISLTRYLLAK